MEPPRVVLDTNVWVSAPCSKRGASHRLLTLIGTGRFELALSTALVLEYEDAAKRQIAELVFTAGEIDRLLDVLCAQAVRSSVFFLAPPLARSRRRLRTGAGGGERCQAPRHLPQT
jgi:hypothetical protein